MKACKYLLIGLTVIVLSLNVYSQGPKGKEFGFGIMLGEPTGLTAKLWVANDQALAFSLGNSYLGALRLGGDYLFHFDAFNSRIVSMYAGPGLAVGFGDSGGWWYNHEDHYWFKEHDQLGFGVRGVFGINIIPRRTPLEIFGEFAVLIAVYPGMHAIPEGAVGVRFYF